MIADLPEKLDLRSMDVAEERRQELLALFPEIRTEGGKIDFERLRLALGDAVDVGKERYGLTWPGKAECFKTIQAPSLGTLRPAPDESVNFDSTENLIIEGDNLEVLKLLQKSYLGKVKLIYIDPPYNTGREFVYPDDYSESLQTYLQYTRQVDSEGKQFSTNTDTEGRFHSKWLDMMYPRLYLARNLLAYDGAIFISIDDHEVDNLRKLCNELLGEENFIATVIWQKVFSPKNSSMYFSEDHDYVVAYARNAAAWRPRLLARTAEADARYDNPDNDPRGPWSSSDLTARNYYGEGQYEVTSPSGRTFRPTVGAYWRVKREKFIEWDNDRRIWWGADGGNMPRLKRFLSDVKQGIVPQTLWTYQDVGHTQEAKKELLAAVPFQETDNVIDSVKPTRLIRRILQVATEPDRSDLVLDFFAGTGTTGDAVLRQNQEDGGNRRFILVQLPEPLDRPESHLRTIADVCETRVRNVGHTLAAEHDGKLDLDGTSRQDRGFRIFKLAESGFKPWQADMPRDGESLATQLELHVDHIREGRTAVDLLYEILLKSGFPLTTPVETLPLLSKTVYSVAEGALLICLERDLTLELIRAMAERKPERVVCLDEGFAGNDQLKTNAVLIFRDKGVTSFKTV